MILLDTSVLSAIMRPNPDRAVVDWLDGQPRNSVWTTSITVLEIRFGLQIMPAGEKRSALIGSFERLLTEAIEDRILPFDTAAAQQAANLMALRHRAGRPVELRDTMIGGIALASRAAIATRNAKHFGDMGLLSINPWAKLPI